MRRPKLVDIPEGFQATGSTKNKSFDFMLITPMFGGDAESWKINTKDPVRSQSVKGQLRFWWRSMQEEQNLSELLRKEGEIWGSTDKQSSVKISILSNPESVKYGTFEKKDYGAGMKDDVVPAYVLFPISSLEEGSINYITELKFTLQVSFPDIHEKAVLNSLKLWTLFGGLGARTRRGTGSLYCEKLLKQFETAKDIEEFIHGFGEDKIELNYPRLKNSKLAFSLNQQGNPQSAWRNLLETYGKYRQGPNNGRASGEKRPGRSYWPEPDSIREIVRDYHPNHEPVHPDRNWFPRAAFGLPIQFEFRDETPKLNKKFMLQPAGDSGERWPSPVILKAIRLPNNTVYKIALIMNQAFPERIILKWDGGEHELSHDEMPLNSGSKQMKTNDKLGIRTIYQHLVDALGLEEV